MPMAISRGKYVERRSNQTAMNRGKWQNYARFLPNTRFAAPRLLWIAINVTQIVLQRETAKHISDLLHEADTHHLRNMANNKQHCIRQLLPATKILPVKLRHSHCRFALPHCHLTGTTVHLYCEVYLLMRIDWLQANVWLHNFAVLEICCAVTFYLLSIASGRCEIKGLLTYLLTWSAKQSASR